MADLKRFERGEDVTALRPKLNDMVEAFHPGAGLPTQSDELPLHFGFVQVQVVSVETDYMICTVTDTGAQVYVALPWQLRRTPFDGQTYNGVSYTYTSNTARDASSGSGSESQVIVPAYVAGDLVYALTGIVGDTSVHETTTQGASLPQPVEWLDLNVDGRAWAKV